MLLAFLALAWQSLLVQTHVHAAARRSTAPVAATGRGTAVILQNAKELGVPGCLLCAAAAQTRATLPPAALGFAVPLFVPGPRPRRRLTRGAPQGRSHSWRSRGPPRR